MQLAFQQAYIIAFARPTVVLEKCVLGGNCECNEVNPWAKREGGALSTSSSRENGYFFLSGGVRTGVVLSHNIYSI